MGVYSNGLRSLIGTFYTPLLRERKPGSIIISTPENMDIEKFKVYDTATEIFLGEASKYLNMGEGKIE